MRMFLGQMSILIILSKKVQKSSKNFGKLMSNKKMKDIFLRNHQYFNKNNRLKRPLFTVDLGNCVIPWLPQKSLMFFFTRRNYWTTLLFDEEDTKKLYYFFENYIEVLEVEESNNELKKVEDVEHTWFDILYSELKLHSFCKVYNVDDTLSDQNIENVYTSSDNSNTKYGTFFTNNKKVILNKFYFYINQINLYFKSFKYYNYFRYFISENVNVLKPMEHILLLNFKRYRFFPNIQTTSGWTYSTTSLGIIRKFLKKPKSFIKNKLVYLIVTSFFRKILLYAGFQNLILFIKKTPVYLLEIMSTLRRPSLALYQHPFQGFVIDEKLHTDAFFFLYILFLNSKSYGFMKSRKKGRIKRKILKRLVKLNKLVD